MIEPVIDKDILNTIIQGSKAGVPLNEIVENYMGKQKQAITVENYNRLLAIFQDHTKYFPNYPLVLNVLSKKFIMDLQTDRYFIYDEEIKRMTPVLKASLQNVFSPKAFQVIQDTRLFSVCLGYNPNSTTLFYEKAGMRYVNLYRPADWQFPYMYDGVPVHKVDIPARYKALFMHLCNHKTVSYNYLINFLAATVQPNKKPKTYLTLLGKQGVGKNTLVDIMIKVLEKDNVTTFTEKSLRDVKFNGTFKNKKLIMFDEVLVKNDGDEKFLKDFVNDTINIEEKGKDRREYDNFASIILAANSLAAVKISPDDRRYSFLDLPEKTLIQFHQEQNIPMSFDEYRGNYILADSEIEKLGIFLLGHAVDQDVLLRPLESETRYKQKDESLSDWEAVVFDVMSPRFAGKEITLNEANQQLAEIVDVKQAKFSRDSWKRLSQTKPGFFTRIRKKNAKGEKQFYLAFEKLDKQPHEKTSEDVE